MNYPKVFYNTIISGIGIFLVFILFKILQDPDAPRTIDNISSTRSTLLFVFGFFFPGFLFGLAVVTGLPALKKGISNKVIYVVFCGLLYIGLVFPAVSSATRAILLSGTGALLAVLFFHLLLAKLRHIMIYALLAFIAGAVAMIPLYLTMDNGGMSDDLKEQIPFLPLMLFPVWHILTGFIIARGVEVQEVG